MRKWTLLFAAAGLWACQEEAPAELQRPDIQDESPFGDVSNTPPPVEDIREELPPEEEVVEEVSAEDTDAPAPPEEEVEVPPPVARVIVMGDVGEGNARQYRVSQAIEQKCARDGCDFAVLLGDNIYDNGVKSVLDSQWETKFEAPYANLDFPFYAVLGNHDNGGLLTQIFGSTFAGAGMEFERGDYQVQYTELSDKWRMPGRTYDFVFEHVHFFGLDTNDMIWSPVEKRAEDRATAQMDLFPELIDDSTATWKIAMGHHPYISNGRHGDAGEYEGLEEGITDLVAAQRYLGGLSEAVSGTVVLEALDRIVCNRVDLYLAGHDHNRQWLLPNDRCPETTFVVSGAGAKLTGFRGNRNPYRFQDDQNGGFFWLEFVGNTLNVEAIDEDGELQWSYRMTKPE